MPDPVDLRWKSSVQFSAIAEYQCQASFYRKTPINKSHFLNTMLQAFMRAKSVERSSMKARGWKWQCCSAVARPIFVPYAPAKTGHFAAHTDPQIVAVLP
jgi:hypothetical protein